MIFFLAEQNAPVSVNKPASQGFREQSMEETIRHFNIRVYALVLNSRREVLLSDEFQMGMRMTKFPGGGMHFGEGTLDCLHREMMEEFSQDVEVIRHYYTTDFFQKALFYDDHQLISIYYLCRLKGEPRFPVSKVPFEQISDINGSQAARWISLRELYPDKYLSFPVDRHVAKMLITDQTL